MNNNTIYFYYVEFFIVLKLCNNQPLSYTFQSKYFEKVADL